MNYVKGDLLSVMSGVIVHGCNAQGVMGSGVAKVLRAKYPDMYTKYNIDIFGAMELGEVSWFRVSNELKIASAITQESYGSDGRRYVSYDAIDTAFQEIFYAAQWNNVTVALPKIGAGLGGGSWEVISAIILNAADKQKYPKENITVYEL
jgi:O-acetyl-ADP-ribose deacetylase (regulator of RNase III)